MIAYQEFEHRLAELFHRIDDCCQRHGRQRDGVRLLPVTKTHPVAAVQYCWQAGLRAVGENRVQEATTKKSELAEPIRWELIGPLQSNKARLAVQTFDLIHSVDRPKIVPILDRLAGELNRLLPILIEVNAGDDPAKHGVSCAEAPALLEMVLRAENLHIEGLMTIAPLDDDPAVAARTFERLRVLRDGLSERFGVPLRELSMGMTSDLEAAIAAGSTCLRVGSALFGERKS